MDEIANNGFKHDPWLDEHYPDWEDGDTVSLPRTVDGKVVFSDRGAAEIVLKDYGQDIHYCDQRGGVWLLWDGVRWVPDNKKTVEYLVKTSIRQYGETAYHVDGLYASDWAQNQENDSRIKATLRSLMSEPGVTLLADELDRDQWLLNCKNGTLDLRTGQLRRHRREDLMTKLVPVEYHDDAECPTWQKFLTRVLGSDEVVEYVQRVVGYSLTGNTSEQVFFLLHGTGQNGKSVFINTLLDLLGDYAQQANFYALTASGSGSEQRSTLVRMPGARLVAATESDRNTRLAEPVLKQLTGGDRVVARALYHEEFEFVPQFKLVMVTNHLPEINAGDYAMWRRVRLIPFPVTIPETERDNKLPEQLKKELPGILAWAVRGCLAWQAGDLRQPPAIRDAEERYRRQTDTIGRFVDQCCVLEPSAETGSTELHEMYERWSEEEGERVQGKNAFSHRLEAVPGVKKSRFTRGKNKGRMSWAGIKLK